MKYIEILIKDEEGNIVETRKYNAEKILKMFSDRSVEYETE